MGTSLCRDFSRLDQLAQALTALSRFKHPALKGMRMMRVHGFEAYLIFYLPSDTGVDVVRVIHGARDLPTLFS
jgi:plasmid stabilization system protein ParE